MSGSHTLRAAEQGVLRYVACLVDTYLREDKDCMLITLHIFMLYMSQNVVCTSVYEHSLSVLSLPNRVICLLWHNLTQHRITCYL